MIAFRIICRNNLVPVCKPCGRDLAKTPSSYLACPWCHTKLYDPIDVVSLSGLTMPGQRKTWQECTPELDEKVGFRNKEKS